MTFNKNNSSFTGDLCIIKLLMIENKFGMNFTFGRPDQTGRADKVDWAGSIG